MPVFECKIKGAEKSRLVKATSAAAARGHIVDAKAISAERLSELIESGVSIEKAVDATDPASHQPGGALHEGGGAPAGDDAGGDPPNGEGGETNDDAPVDPPVEGAEAPASGRRGKA